MILSFKTKINDKPTYFPEKIITGLFKQKIISKDKATELFYPQTLVKLIPMEYHGTINDVAVSQIKFDNSINHKQKLHTIRKDDKNRWKPGIMIDFFINARQKNMFRFAPMIPVVSTQKIKIVWSEFKINGNPAVLPAVWIDDKLHYDYAGVMTGNMLKIANNDGFENLTDFFSYFNEDFEGKIIHWTNLKY